MPKKKTYRHAIVYQLSTNVRTVTRKWLMFRITTKFSDVTKVISDNNLFIALMNICKFYMLQIRMTTESHVQNAMTVLLATTLENKQMCSKVDTNV